ncbi:energy-coupling factor transporter ATPase [Anaeromicropila populeti]|uniref:Energy-coupling factor transport system ATP-binding protein n=1 Tax=Anaeromicropila populeti TaxID=37658 RepID=A0A1I6ID56_9FIRM|nr:energy-coupling factor transporter ATPase [Anaeromicropila populeti]SFR64290.1 energy-coupling factor transport system ATP-binding protein [Anaeromicropila populeti]
MDIVKTKELVYEYIRKREDGSIEAVKRAVDDVNITVKKGDFVAILGHNGSGKSTLAKQLNAILVPTEGTIWIDGKDTKDESLIWDIRQTAGMVFQNPDNQIIANVVEEDVGFGPENLGIPTEEIWKRVDESLKAVGMTEYRYHSPNRLSGGQKQRIAIAGILAMKPSCIVLDEPTAMLDPNGRKEVLQALLDLNRKEKITIILITHYMEEVIHADSVIIMDKGKVVMEGTPGQIFQQVEKLQELRLSVPQVTELAYRLEKGGLLINNKAILSVDELIEELIKWKKTSQCVNRK